MAAASEGARLLAATGASLRTIGRAAGVSYESARQWLAGAKVPAPAARAAMEAAYGIPVGAWDRSPPVEPSTRPRKTARTSAPPASAPPTRPAKATRSPRPDDARARLQAQLKRIDLLRAEIGLTPAAKLQLEAAEGRALTLLARLSGEGLTLSEAKIVAAPAFQRILAALVAALAPGPAAQLAVAGTLEDLDGRAA